MTTKEIKSSFHDLIDEFDNPKVLEQFYEAMKSVQSKNSSEDFWDQLSDEQKKELDMAFTESEDENNLVPNEMVMDKARKWTNK